MSPPYDTIGLNYANLRRPDPRIAKRIVDALGDAWTVLNVGAGAGSYEPVDRAVTALEPSVAMIRQRPPTAAPAVRGRAEALPFENGSFDASMAILTVHHWTDKAKGLSEMRRVTRGRIVLLTFDPSHSGSWLADYLPELKTFDKAQMPQIKDYERWLGPVETVPIPVPHDCTDGFLYAYWRRPKAYLDPVVRAAMSSFHALGDVSEALDRLRTDLDSGTWMNRHGAILHLDALDTGYRLVTTR